MNEEILKLLRENNIMLKQICSYLAQNGGENPTKEFMINLVANLMSEDILCKRK